MRRAVGLFEVLIQLVIFYSLVVYFLELEFTDTEHTLQGHPFFLWSERFVAGVFSIEYLIRWACARRRLLYPLTPLALVDLAAVLPFYCGFLVDMRMLRLVRTLRVLRLFKLYRYNEALRSFVSSYGKVKRELHILGVAILLLVVLSGTIVFEAERDVQKEMFRKYSDGIWWSVVTLTTVGYGDKYPITITGRLTACITLFIGLGLFGSFISLVGGAFLATLNERREARHQVNLTPEAASRIVHLLESRHRPINEEEAGRLVLHALELLEAKLGNP